MNSSEPGNLPADSPVGLRGAALIFRLAVIGAVIAGIAGLFLYAGGWFTPHALTPARFTDRFESVNGIHPGFRRNHAKGVCFSGWFESNGQGTTLSHAPVFNPGRTPILGRFSFSGGQPYAPDSATMVRGLAILFRLLDGEEWRTAMVNLPVFPAKSPAAFYELLEASAPDPATGKPDPARMGAFLKQYPDSARALGLIHQYTMYSGFENSTFNSLNAFQFTDAAGKVLAVRWSLAPVQPFAPAETMHPGPLGTNYLFDALIESVHQHPGQWHLLINVAQPGDPTDDATTAWPPDRRQVDVGVVTVDQVESEETSPACDINFDPLILPKGMAPSDDPLLSARSAVYSQSFTRREGEAKQPSAVSTTETGKPQ